MPGKGVERGLLRVYLCGLAEFVTVFLLLVRGSSQLCPPLAGGDTQPEQRLVARSVCKALKESLLQKRAAFLLFLLVLAGHPIPPHWLHPLLSILPVIPLHGTLSQ